MSKPGSPLASRYSPRSPRRSLNFLNEERRDQGLNWNRGTRYTERFNLGPGVGNDLNGLFYGTTGYRRSDLGGNTSPRLVRYGKQHQDNSMWNRENQWGYARQGLAKKAGATIPGSPGRHWEAPGVRELKYLSSSRLYDDGEEY